MESTPTQASDPDLKSETLEEALPSQPEDFAASWDSLPADSEAEVDYDPEFLDRQHGFDMEDSIHVTPFIEKIARLRYEKTEHAEDMGWEQFKEEFPEQAMDRFSRPTMLEVSQAMPLLLAEQDRVKRRHLAAVAPVAQLPEPEMTPIEALSPNPEVSVDLSIYLPDGRRFCFTEAQEYPEYVAGESGKIESDEIFDVLEQVIQASAARFGFGVQFHQ